MTTPTEETKTMSISITTTATAELGYPVTLRTLRAFLDGTAELPDDAVVDIRTTDNQRDGDYTTATITVTP